MPFPPPSSPPLLANSSQPAPLVVHLSHHKVNPGAVALASPAFQLMDEWAPYRMALLLLLVASSVALWASYKILCEAEERAEVHYQPLSALQGEGRMGQMIGQMEEWSECSSAADDVELEADK